MLREHGVDYGSNVESFGYDVGHVTVEGYTPALPNPKYFADRVHKKFFPLRDGVAGAFQREKQIASDFCVLIATFHRCSLAEIMSKF